MQNHRLPEILSFAVIALLFLSGCAPGSSPTPSPSPYKTSTPTPTSSPSYSLQRPNIQQLIDVIAELRAWKQQNPLSDTWQDEITSAGMSAIDELIANDLKRHYPDGFQGDIQYIENIPTEWDDLPFFPPSTSVLEILFHQSIPEYFNKNQVQFTHKGGKQFSSFSVKSFLMTSKEVDNTKPLWLLEIDLTKQQLRYWLTLRQDQNGIYHVVPNDIKPVSLKFGHSYSELTTDTDINNDGNNDILLLTSYYSIGSVKKTISIYTPNVQGVYLLDTVQLPHPPPYFDSYASEYKFGDHNKDGLVDIQVTTPEFEPFDCAWESIRIIQFKDKERTDQTSNTEIPNTASCAPAKTLYNPNPQEIQPLLKIAQANLSKDASSDFRAWIQLRLGMSYYAQAKDSQALQELNQINQISPVGTFQKAIQDAYAESHASPLRLCEKLYDIAYQKEITGYNFDSDIDVDLAHFGAYPMTMIPIPNYVCPYIDILNFRLHTISDNNTNPDAAFTRLGLALSSTYSVNLDADPQLEWIGLLGKDWPKLIFIDRTENHWHILKKTSYESSHTDLQVKTFDVTNDQYAEVLISFVANSPPRETCTENKRRFILIILDTHYLEDPTLLHQDMGCAAQSPLDSMSLQQMRDLLTKEDENSDPFYQVEHPAWAKFIYNHGDSWSILNEIDTVEKTMLENKEYGQSRTKIDAILQSLPENDAAADMLRERLIYIIGLSYELEGNQEMALKNYLGLIKTSPDSLWSKLAQSRIATK